MGGASVGGALTGLPREAVGELLMVDEFITS